MRYVGSQCLIILARDARGRFNYYLYYATDEKLREGRFLYKDTLLRLFLYASLLYEHAEDLEQ